MIESNIKNFINKKKINYSILTDILINGCEEISEENYPFYFVKESYVNSAMGDELYNQFHSTLIKEALNIFVAPQMDSKSRMRYKHLLDLEVEENLKSKFMAQQEIEQSPFSNFYKECFSSHLRQNIPKTHRHVRIHYMLREQKIFFLVVTHQNLILNVKVYVYVPLNTLEEINKSNFSFALLKIEQPIQRGLFAKYMLETMVDSFTGLNFYHFSRYLIKNNIDPPVYFNEMGVVFRDVKTNPVFNVSNWSYIVQNYLNQHIANNDLPSYFGLALDPQRFFKSSMQKFCTFIIYSNDEEFFDFSKINAYLLIEFTDKLRVDNASKNDIAIVQKPFLIVNILYNASRSDCENSFMAHEKEFLQRIGSVLFYNYYLHILFDKLLEKDQKSVSKYLYLFRKFSVS